MKFAQLGAWIHKSWNGEILDPNKMVNDLFGVKTETVQKTEEQEKAETRAALMLMGECLKAGA